MKMFKLVSTDTLRALFRVQKGIAMHEHVQCSIHNVGGTEQYITYNMWQGTEQCVQVYGSLRGTVQLLTIRSWVVQLLIASKVHVAQVVCHIVFKKSKILLIIQTKKYSRSIQEASAREDDL